MELVTPGIGLIFWQTVVFLVVFAVLAMFVWKPITEALRAREGFINDSLRAAELAKEEMNQLKADNEYLLQEARFEREKILKEATTAANQLKEEAKAETAKITEKMVNDAKQSIESEKQNALKDVRNLVASLSLDIAEKVIRQDLSKDTAQKKLIEEFVKDIKVN
ncbi:MAG: F0F1 ATP synthase subunit B [Cyclobacteriaceae bacterium]